MFTALTLVLAGFAAVSTERASAASQTLFSQAAAASVAAYGGHVLTSQWDASAHRFGLVDIAGGTPVRVPVASLKVPFDVSLGPDTSGRATAVFTRCTSYGGLASPPAAPVRFLTAKGCRLRSLTLAPGARERTIEGTHAKGGSEFFPSMWRGRLAFFRLFPGRSGLASRIPKLILKRPGEANRVLVSGPAGQTAQTGEIGQGPLSLSLVGTRLLWGYSYLATFKACPGPSLQAEPTLLREASTSSSARTLDGGCSSRSASIGAAAQTAGRQAYVRAANGQPDAIRLRSTTTGRTRDTPITSFGLPATAVITDLAITSNTLVIVYRADVQATASSVIETTLSA